MAPHANETLTPNKLWSRHSPPLSRIGWTTNSTIRSMNRVLQVFLEVLSFIRKGTQKKQETEGETEASRLDSQPNEP